MLVNDFDYDLPEELIAQVPLLDRSSSRLLVLKPKALEMIDEQFRNIFEYLRSGDIIVRNNTKVIPARLFGVKEETNALVELLLLEQSLDNWECLVGNAKVVKVGTVINFNNGELKAKCIEVKEQGIRVFTMISQGIFLEVLNKLGETPLPPYIHEKLKDSDRYQTLYASVYGSAAAPTAGLHFTDELFDKLKNKGVNVIDVTLHIGLDTFRPVKVSEVSEHHMHSEFYQMSEETATALNKAKENGQRIIALGTTSARTLEANFSKYGKFKATGEKTNIFIYPGYHFKAIDCLITNFHLPKSTLLMMVSALAGQEFIKQAYQHAINERYRFFSFGDSMLILNE